jgi:hypothetical protein
MSDQRQAIIEYGEGKYAMGYKDGYVSGIISGILMSTMCLMLFTLIKKET